MNGCDGSLVSMMEGGRLSALIDDDSTVWVFGAAPEVAVKVDGFGDAASDGGVLDVSMAALCFLDWR